MAAERWRSLRGAGRPRLSLHTCSCEQASPRGEAWGGVEEGANVGKRRAAAKRGFIEARNAAGLVNRTANFAVRSSRDMAPGARHGRETAERQPRGSRQTGARPPTDSRQTADRQPTDRRQTADRQPTDSRQTAEIPFAQALSSDLRLLSASHGFVGTAASWTSRLALLAITGERGALPPFVMLDRPLGQLWFAGKS